MRGSDRAAAKRYADEHGYFWIACPRCGEYFSGHEWGPMVHADVVCLRDDTRGHGACCTKVSDEADAQACRRSHERLGD